ncbi:MAG TPA: divalent-cation tolerance protein CutA, partial [bacterium]|nr:divalent-cation tolerance protein CutA [bacterium]
MPAQALLVLTTVAKKPDAARIAITLLREGLIACANILNQVESHYTWKDKLETENEWLLLMKTTPAAFPLLENRLIRIHPYECPEIVALAADKVGKAYAAWLQASVVGMPSKTAKHEASHAQLGLTLPERKTKLKPKKIVKRK